ncbi:uncharacterized protein LOC107021514 [Solanum pennellii]|uniref:Uncharacterized protein LOC107021514 n=1 Tax=Solanum pennellii TaxID=28526 RepID=A0ABM1GYC7_SOLPN|nr:uncharacterized protein LOC107021514 [Solanum pennellii]
MTLQVFQEHWLYAKFSESVFWLRSVIFLSHVVSDLGVEVDPKKIKAVKNWLRPLTPIDIRTFLDLTNHYRRFVEGFSAIAASLTSLTKKKVMFEWSETCEERFQKLKERLPSALLLTLPRNGEG